MSFSFSVCQIAELAVEVEEAAANFYKQLALRTKDAAMREAFELLSQQESDHRNTFADMAKALKSGHEEHEYAIDLYGVMKYTLDKLKSTAFPPVITARPQDILEALDVAMKAEEAAVNVYTQLRNTVTEPFHKTLDGILKVEQYHCKWVADLRNKINGLS